MKNRILGLFILTGFALGFQSCKEDITPSGEFIETAVVYGILDSSDSLHMIKITRAYIGDGEANNNTIASIPDSSYFQSVEGTVSEYVDGIETRVFILEDTIVENKDENGIFYAPTQKLYYFSSIGAPLNDDAEYRLNLNINNGLFEVSGRTELVNSMTETTSSGTIPYRFIQSNGEYTTTSVKVNSGSATQVNCKLTIAFTEWIGTTPTQKSFDWNLGEVNAETGQEILFPALGQTFFELMASNTTNDASITKRTFDGITTTTIGGSEELSRYISINEPSSSLAQTKPSFTNLEATGGHPVVGIFTSKSTKTRYVPFVGGGIARCISSQTTGFLCEGSLTYNLLFCSDHPNDVLQSFYCP